MSAPNLEPSQEAQQPDVGAGAGTADRWLDWVVQAGTAKAARGLERNRIPTLSLAEKGLHELHSLEPFRTCRTLYLFGNHLRSLQGGDLHLLPLTALLLQDNHLTDTAAIRGIRTLTRLDLSRNPLTALEGLAGLPLESLVVTGTFALTGTALSIDSLPRTLTSLDLSETGTASAAVCAPLTRLDTLILARNHIASMEDIAPALDCPRLAVLDLTGCPCTADRKWRERVVVAGPALRTIDGKDVTRNERMYLARFDEAKRNPKERGVSGKGKATGQILQLEPTVIPVVPKPQGKT